MTRIIVPGTSDPMPGDQGWTDDGYEEAPPPRVTGGWSRPGQISELMRRELERIRRLPDGHPERRGIFGRRERI
ncbi:MAG TPA: hypothetical protein VIV12_27765 [Streptosporangiaceae bacterium]